MTPPVFVQQLLAQFKTKQTSGVYKYFTNRVDIADQIMKRIIDPHEIDQGQSSLCAPAAFLYNIAQKYPLVYAKYITDLYDSGIAKLGSLEVKPGLDTRNYNLPIESGMSRVDWIGLAGLRDSENDFLDYQSYTDRSAGITMPGDLLAWFTKAGFASGVNDTNLQTDKKLSTLIQAHLKKQQGHAVCLFVGAKVFSGEKGGQDIPDHWAVLNSPIFIDNKSVQPLVAKGKTINNDESILSKKLSFNVYHWGQNAYPVNRRIPDLTVEYFLNYFYGYISAK